MSFQNISKSITLMLMITVPVFLNGCGILIMKKNTPITVVPDDRQRAYSFKININDTNGKPIKLDDITTKMLDNEFISTVKEFGLGQRVTDDSAEMNFDVSIVNYTRDLYITSFLRGFTLTLFPTCFTYYSKIMVNSIDKTHNKSYYEVSDSIPVVVWLPLVLTMPFTQPGNIVMNWRKNMYRQILGTIKYEGRI